MVRKRGRERERERDSVCSHFSFFFKSPNIESLGLLSNDFM
jgi:hypothetical protein